MAYSGHNGVKYRRYDDEEDEEEQFEEPDQDETNAVLEELHYESWDGSLNISVETEDGFLSLSIPVKADRDWNDFVDSLPKWE